MICKHCGKEAPDGSTFCPYCGKNPVEDSSGNTKPFVISLSKRNLILLASAAAVLLITIPILLVVFLWSGGPRSVPADTNDTTASSESPLPEESESTKAPISSGEQSETEASTPASIPSSPEETELKDKPIYIGYKNAGTLLQNVRAASKAEVRRLSLSVAKTADLRKATLAATQVPYNTPVTVQLEYSNPSRDLILDILVDDSAAGKNCVYSTDSSQYKISSIDTAWDDSRSSYVSTVTLVIPAAETAEKRTLTIRETSFLRDRIEGKADFDVNAGRTIELECDALADALKTRENSDGTLTVTGYRGDLRDLTIPEVYMGKPVTAIADRAFSGAGFTSVTIPDTITEMGNYVFENCTNLKTVNITYFIERKVGGKGMFKNCTSLETIDLTPFFFGDFSEMFMSCSSLKTVTGDNLNRREDRTLPADMFRGCTSLVSIFIPTRGTAVSADAFKDCASLQTIKFESAPHFREKSLNNCSNLTILTSDSISIVLDGEYLYCDKNGYISEERNIQVVIGQQP